MNQYLNIFEENRNALFGRIKNLSVQQINFIPAGHSNNIIWNMGHMLAVSESILYKNSGFSPPVHEFEIGLFGRNTEPDQPFGTEVISLIQTAMLGTIKTFRETTGINSLQTFGASQMVTEGALQFLLFHEGLHYRTIASLQDKI